MVTRTKRMKTNGNMNCRKDKTTYYDLAKIVKQNKKLKDNLRIYTDYHWGNSEAGQLAGNV